MRVFPDVLVYDGEVPESRASPTQAPQFKVLNYPLNDGDRDVPPQPPLPDPLPERAFAHIRPEDWLPALSEPGESGPGEGTVVNVSADIVEVPLEVLPGREREFSNFVSKVSKFVVCILQSDSESDLGCIWDARCTSGPAGRGCRRCSCQRPSL